MNLNCSFHDGRNSPTELGFKIKVRLKPKGKIEEKPPRMAYIHFLEISESKACMKGLNPCLEFSFQQRQKVYATHDYQFKELVLPSLTYISKQCLLYLFSSDYDSNII